MRCLSISITIKSHALAELQTIQRIWIFELKVELGYEVGDKKNP